MVKLDVENYWRGQKRETVFINRYGLLATIVTKSLDQMTVEKLAAYLGREETQPRDLYDLVWLLSHGNTPDLHFAKQNHLLPDLLQKARKKVCRAAEMLTDIKPNYGRFF